MEEDLRNALRKLGIENIDKVIQFLQEQKLIEKAWESRGSLINLLNNYGSIKHTPKHTPTGTKTITSFIFN